MRSFVVFEALVLVLNSDTLLSFTIVHNSILFSVIFIAGEYRKKGCLRRKYPDLGWNFNSLTNPSEQLSEEEDQSELDGEAPPERGIFFRPQVYHEW